MRLGDETDGVESAAIGKVEEAKSTFFDLALAEVDDPDLAVIELDFGEIETGADVNVEIKSVAAIVNVESSVDPVLAAGDDFAVFPEQTVTGGKRDDSARPNDRRGVDNGTADDDGGGARRADDDGPGGPVDGVAGADAHLERLEPE